MKNVEECKDHLWQLDYLLKAGHAVEAHSNGNDKYFSWGHKAEFSCSKCYAKAERNLTNDEYQDLLNDVSGLKEHDLLRHPGYQRHFYRREAAADGKDK